MTNPPQWPFTVNWESPLSRGLIDWWPLHRATKTRNMVDLDNHFSLVGTPPHINSASGFSGYEGRGDAEADRLRITGYSKLDKVDDNNATPYTVGLWAIHGSAQDSTNPAFIDNNADGNSYQGPIMVHHVASGDNVKVFGFVGTVGDFSFPQDGKFHHLCVVMYSGPIGFEVYLDGVSQGTYSGAPTSGGQAGTNLNLLWRSRFDYYLDGAVANLQIHHASFSAGEVAALYDPATRFDLYYELGRRTYFVPAAAGLSIPIAAYHHRHNNMAA